MKTLILFFLFINSVFALELERVKQDGSVVHSQKFNLTSSSSTYIKKSNFFDLKESYRLGNLVINSDQTEKIRLKLKDTLSKIKTVDDSLKQKGKSFNDLSLKNSDHYSVFKLNDFLIKKDSVLYQEIEEAFVSLKKLEWKMVKGIIIDPKFTTISYIEDQKTKSSEKFDMKFYCKYPTPPTICRLKDYGHLLLGK